MVEHFNQQETEGSESLVFEQNVALVTVRNVEAFGWLDYSVQNILDE